MDPRSSASEPHAASSGASSGAAPGGADLAAGGAHALSLSAFLPGSAPEELCLLLARLLGPCELVRLGGVSRALRAARARWTLAQSCGPELAAFAESVLGAPAETLALELVSPRGLVALREVDGHGESASMALGARRLSPGEPGAPSARLGRGGLQVQYSASLARGAWVFSQHVPSCLLRRGTVRPLGVAEDAEDWLPHGLNVSNVWWVDFGWAMTAEQLPPVSGRFQLSVRLILGPHASCFADEVPLTVRLGESELSSKPLLTQREQGDIRARARGQSVCLQLKVCELELDRASPRALNASFLSTAATFKTGVELYSLVLTEIGRQSSEQSSEQSTEESSGQPIVQASEPPARSDTPPHVGATTTSY
jgi:hypothetical protein